MKQKNPKPSVKNIMKLCLPSQSCNEAMARAVVAAFCAQLDPETTELADVKCAVSEAVTNCIVHAYRDTIGKIYITVTLMTDNSARIEVKDRGCGIENVKQAMEPLFTTDAESERSGMGFTVMESFCDKVRVTSKPGGGTRVVMIKRFAQRLPDTK